MFWGAASEMVPATVCSKLRRSSTGVAVGVGWGTGAVGVGEEGVTPVGRLGGSVVHR